MRGYDAVHLACAVQLHSDDVLMATWDDALNVAARATGQIIANDTARAVPLDCREAPVPAALSGDFEATERTRQKLARNSERAEHAA